MEKITLDAHPSVVIAFCERTTELLMAVYDGTYPQVSYRFSANNIGGNPSPSDKSPQDVLLKEIKEEYDPNHGEMTKFGEAVLWASRTEIELIQDELLRNIVPYQDFLVRAVQFPNDSTTKAYTAIYSAFFTILSNQTIEIAKSNIRRCRRLSPEGLTGVFTLDELTNDSVKRDLSTAHATAPILNRFFDSRIPFPSELNARGIGCVRTSFEDYQNDFSYNEKIARATGLLK